MSGFLPGHALSVRQPWAWAIVHGGKDVENRTKLAITKGGIAAAVGRKIAIHAAKGMTRDEYEHARDFMVGIGVECPRPDVLVRGAIIGSVYVTGIAKDGGSPWFFGPWALELERPEAVDPIAVPGSLGLFFWEQRAKRGDAAAEPLPWMRAWPNRAAPKAVAVPDNQLGLGFGS